MEPFKVGDIVYLKKDYCEKNRIIDIPRKIIELKYYQRTYGGDLELYYYTIEYGNGGHDVKINDVDYYKTIRIIKLNELGI